MTQAVLLGGLFIGVLSALPIVNLANCCCLWIVGGGAITAAVNVMVAPLQQSAADLMLRNATDIPPDVRTWLESVGNSASMPMRMVFGFFFQLFVAAPFASLGGLIGAALFARPSQPQEEP